MRRRRMLTPLELDIESGELLFEWASLDHVAPDGMPDSIVSLPAY